MLSNIGGNQDAFETAFAAVYDGIYHFALAPTGVFEGLRINLNNGSEFQDGISVKVGVTAYTEGLTGIFHLSLLMKAGWSLEYQGPTASLYGYRVSDEL